MDGTGGTPTGPPQAQTLLSSGTMEREIQDGVLSQGQIPGMTKKAVVTQPLENISVCPTISTLRVFFWKRADA